MRLVFPVFVLLGLAACSSDRATLERIDGRLARIEGRLAAMEETAAQRAAAPAPPTVYVPSVWSPVDVTGVRIPTVIPPAEWRTIVDAGGCVLPERGQHRVVLQPGGIIVLTPPAQPATPAEKIEEAPPPAPTTPPAPPDAPPPR